MFANYVGQMRRMFEACIVAHVEYLLYRWYNSLFCIEYSITNPLSSWFIMHCANTTAATAIAATEAIVVAREKATFRFGASTWPIAVVQLSKEKTP